MTSLPLEMRSQRIPVHTITGFLGSGKTTLLKRLLREPDFADTAVLINEFGEIALDHAIVQAIDSKTVVLNSGCICCSVRDDLASALRDLLSQRKRGVIGPFGRIVIETTGLSEPAPILATLSLDPVVRHHLQPGRVVTVVDSMNATSHEKNHPEWIRQVVAADTIVLTKTDLIDRARVDRLSAHLVAVNPTAMVVDANIDNIEVGLVESGPFQASVEAIGALERWIGDEDRLATQANKSLHATVPADLGSEASDVSKDHASDHHGVEALCLRVSEPLDWAAFGVWLSMLVHAHGDRVLRIKGLLRLKGIDGYIFVHGVQHVIHRPIHLPWSTDDESDSRIVIICSGLPLQQVQESFETFVMRDLW